MSWQRVGKLGDLPEGTAMEVKIGEEPICLVRRSDGEVRAVHNICSHELWSLHDGWVDDDAIECTLHGSSFDLDTGQPKSLPAVKPIPVYACKVEDGEILVDVDQQLNDAPVPRH
ncbi:MAG: non-heme iron oxygenase ferredoxin subunit [Egibacteraceae bacterium]